MASNLVLFGKHPAWSDHMFISDDRNASHYLKRVFYDHSVIPALQGGQGDQRVSEEWSFLIFIDEQVFFIVNAVSRDSVGRRRFPLIAAYSLPQKLRLETALNKLRELKGELLSFLDEVLESPDEDLNHWQELVTQKTKSFKTKVDWSSIDSDQSRCQLKPDAVAGLMTRLINDSDALDLKSCSFFEAYSFIQLGLKQFKSAPPAMIILDQEENGLGLFFSLKDGSSFHLKRHLYNNLTSLTVSEENIPPKVNRLLESITVNDNVVLVDDAPSLKLGDQHGSFGNKFVVFAVSLLLVVSILFGLFYSCSESNSGQTNEIETSPSQSSKREKWTSNAAAYIEWIEPLSAFVDKQTMPIVGFDSVAKVLKTDLDPFAVVKAEKASMKLAKNPPSQFFDPQNIAGLNTVYSNIDQLKASLTGYYEEQFSGELLKELKRQNYSKPSFIKVDFSQQPLRPNFGPELVNQFESYLRDQNALSELVTSTKMLWDSIIKPLHELCPEHAKYIQRYIQSLVSESENLEQFQYSYKDLLNIFGYPKFIQLDTVDMSHLSEDAEWLKLPEQEKSVEALHKLVELLEASQKKESQGQPLSQPLSKIGKSVETIKQPTVETIEQPTDLIDQSLNKQVLQLDSDSGEWDFFLEAKLKQLQDSLFVSEIKDHADAIRLRILEDPTLDSNQSIQQIQDQTNKLIEAFRSLDVDSMQGSSKLHSAYLENEQSAKRLSDYIFSKYTETNVEKGDLESLTKASQEIIDSIDTNLASLDSLLSDLEASFFSNQSDITEVNLSEQVDKITTNPLYFENVLGSKLEIIKTAASGNSISIETTKDFVWYASNLISKGVITEEQLIVITKVFNNLDPVNHTSEVKNLVRQGFDKYIQKLRAEKPEELLNFYKNLKVYLPQELHTQEDQAFGQIADYWSRCNKDPNFEASVKEDLEGLENSAQSQIVKQFYKKLSAEHSRINLRLSSSIFDEIRKIEGVESVSLSNDQSRVEVAFEGISRRLVFLPVETQTGAFLAQQKPLSLQQYIKLSSICGIDTEYYLTLQDAFWPRSFEVGMGIGFSALDKWQFQNEDVFAPMRAFNKNTLPSHLNEPNQVLRMADFFGFRLLKPSECVALVRLADVSSINRLKFSEVDKERLEDANTIQSSVYSGLISESIKQNSWSGGIDFERYDPGENKFFDVVGGSAELAYDGTDFYVCGGSWLYEPSTLEKPVKVAEPQRIYTDIGIRFAMDVQAQDFTVVVKKLALQFLTESE